MSEGTPLLESGLVLLAAALAGAFSRRFGMPAMLGYLALGIAVSPFTPGYVADRGQLQVLADVGVVMLLFEVGVQLDARTLARESRGLLAAAPAQMLVTTALSAAVLLALGLASPSGAATIAFAIALSSSVVVINITRSRRRPPDQTTSRALLVWAVNQDAFSLLGVAVLTAALLPSGAAAIPFAVLQLAAFAAFAFALHSSLVPRLLRALHGQPDSFLAVAVSVALATAGAGSVLFGVPLALAAFVAGAALGLRPEAREARAVLLPFRDLFAILFFVAVGTLLDPRALLPSAFLIAVALALVLAKAVTVTALAAAFRIRARRWQLGIGLGQIGEFSFVVLGIGVAAGAITTDQFSAVLAASVLSIALSTVAVRLFRGARVSVP